jgi:GTP-binding protein LepA
MQAGTSTSPSRSGPPPGAHAGPELGPGEVGYLIAGIKDVGEARSGETVTTATRRRRAAATATATRSRWCSAVCSPIDGDDFD